MNSLDFWQKIKNFFIHPGEFFQELIDNPRFAVPLSLIIVAQGLFTWVLLRVNGTNMDEIISRTPILMIISITIAVVGGLVLFFVSCLIYYFLFKMMFRKVQFRELVAVFAYVEIPKAIKVFILAYITTISGKIQSSFGLDLMFNFDSKVINNIIGGLDCFSLWSLLLLGIGLNYLLQVSHKVSFLIASVLVLLPILLIPFLNK